MHDFFFGYGEFLNLRIVPIQFVEIYWYVVLF